MPEIILSTYPKKIVVFITNGPSSYTTGGFTIRSDTLSVIEHVISVSATEGWIGEVQSVSGNTATIKVYGLPSSLAAGPLAEVAAGTDLSGVTFYIILVGY